MNKTKICNTFNGVSNEINFKTTLWAIHINQLSLILKEYHEKNVWFQQMAGIDLMLFPYMKYAMRIEGHIFWRHCFTMSAKFDSN